jgi:lipid A 3-O-deacylase
MWFRKIRNRQVRHEQTLLLLKPLSLWSRFRMLMTTKLLTFIFLVFIVSSCFRKDDKQDIPAKEPAKQSSQAITIPPPTKSIVVADTVMAQKQSETQPSEIYSVIREEEVGTLVPGNSRGIPVVRQEKEVIAGNELPPLNEPETEPLTTLNRFLILHFENDILAERDLYYSNGLAITYIHPALQHLPLSRHLPGLGRQSINQYGLHIRQEIYTPDIPEATEIDPTDRPFAGVLLFSLFRLSSLPEHNFRMQSELQFGALGTYSGAEALQRKAHRREPSGWVHQIRNDVLINVNIHAEKGLLSASYSELGLMAGIKAGSLRTQFYGGAFFRLGKYAGTINSPSSRMEMMLSQKRNRKLQYWLFGRAQGKSVLFDATLNGGLFNKTSPHWFTMEQLHRQVIQAELGFVVVYRQFGLQFGYTYLSPEFKGGIAHIWGSLQLIYTN